MNKPKLFLGLLLLTGWLLGCSFLDSHEDDHSTHGHGLDAFGGSQDSTNAKTLPAMMVRGQAIYKGVCSACHGEEGLGMVGAYPPLANSDFLVADRKRSIQILFQGLRGEIVVNGQVYLRILCTKDSQHGEFEVPCWDASIANQLNDFFSQYG